MYASVQFFLNRFKGDTYLTQCFPEVKKFIQKYHSGDKVLFLAS